MWLIFHLFEIKWWFLAYFDFLASISTPISQKKTYQLPTPYSDTPEWCILFGPQNAQLFTYVWRPLIDNFARLFGL